MDIQHHTIAIVLFSIVGESPGESIQDGCETSNDVRCRDTGSEESTREEVRCGGDDDDTMDEWSHQAGQN